MIDNPILNSPFSEPARQAGRRRHRHEVRTSGATHHREATTPTVPAIPAMVVSRVRILTTAANRARTPAIGPPAIPMPPTFPAMAGEDHPRAPNGLPRLTPRTLTSDTVKGRRIALASGRLAVGFLSLCRSQPGKRCVDVAADRLEDLHIQRTVLGLHCRRYARDGHRGGRR